ncbi:phage-like element PBSX protein xkdK [Desulfocucumis palustris]|uniref:Phage-like element PBSX protein xkdK n=1 Tax=Desulfocucumis palustris TaxID=1898651 RepID=A0A2L2XMD6_9FIRM|nr:phage tail sheath family protein [Desulfocucumis palustris]GBF35496.1 phage-like element PBSX protein xkdK [Desulfocucumis palustris]
MAGGTWSATEIPVLPGLYLNFEAAALAAIQPGARGVVVAPVKAHWGPVREFVEINSEAAINDYFSADHTGGSTAATTLKLILLGGAGKVLAYRLADGSAAKAGVTLKDGSAADVLGITARYEGARGNNFKITVGDNPADGVNKQDLQLFEGSVLLRTFTFNKGAGVVDNAVAAINSDPANKWVRAAKLAGGDGTIAGVPDQPLSGGNSGIASIGAAEYAGALTAFETRDFNLIALDGVYDPAIQTSLVSWAGRMREEGKGIIAVLGGQASDDTAPEAVGKAIARSAGFNHEGIVNVGTGAILDGVAYSSAQLSAYVAGLIAGQKLSEATTYAATPFDDVTRRWTRSEMEQAVAGGVFLLFHDGLLVKALRGMNSLVTLRQGQNNSWKKIRTIRVMDAVNTDLLRAAEDNYIGKVNNTEEGRLALIGACKQYMQSLAQAGIIENTGWDVYLDPDYYGTGAVNTPEPDQVYLRWEARLTDVMEQIFGTFIVK